MKLPELYTLAEIAEKTGVSRQMLYHFWHWGFIDPLVEKDAGVLFSKDAILDVKRITAINREKGISFHNIRKAMKEAK